MPKLLDILVPSRFDPSLEYRLREQIPYIALTTFFLCLAYLAVLCFSCVIYGFDFFFFTMLVILSVQIFALVSLRTGKYRRGASMTTISLLLSSLAVLFLMQYSGNTTMEIFRPLCFVMITMCINVMVAVNNRQIWMFFIPFLAGWALSFATIFRHYFDMKEESQFAVVSLCLGIVALVWQTTTLLLIRQLSERMLSKAAEEMEKASKSVENLTRIISEAKEGMNIGGEIISATHQAQKAVMNVSEIQDYLGKETNRLVTETETMIGSSRNVIANTQKMKGSITVQTAAITETSAAIVEISQNIESINKVALQRRSMLDDAESAGKSQKVRIEKLGKAFTSVMDSTEGISQFVTTVQDIASRTALLSMNASIEAARAGSSGKGFAVVAQEIRALSGETQKNADMIKQMIEKNDRTVRETGTLVNEFSAFIGSNIENTQILINSIDEILTGIAEMNTGTQDVMQAVGRLLSGTNDSSQMVNNVVTQIDLQQESFNHLSGFAKELNFRIMKLREAVTDIRSSTDLVSEAGNRNIAQAKKLQL